VRDVETGHKYAKTAAEAGAFAVKAGLDNDCTTSGLGFGQPGVPDYQRYIDAVKQGLLTEAEMDGALKRMLRIRFEVGLFDPLDTVKAAQVRESDFDSPAHRELALALARKSMVLLKNDGVLPFAKPPSKIAVVGPLADNSRVLLGNYNGYPTRSTTALAGTQQQFPQATVTFEPGTTYLRPNVLVPTSALTAATGAPGLTAEIFAEGGFTGAPVETRIDSHVASGRDRLTGGPPPDFTALAAAPPAKPTRWSGFLTAPETGTYRLGVEGFGNEMYLDGKKIVSAGSGFPPPPSIVDIALVKGKRYPIRIEATPRRMASTRFVWMPPSLDAEARAVAAARTQAKKAAWLSRRRSTARTIRRVGCRSPSIQGSTSCRISRTTRWRGGPTGTSTASRCSPSGSG
jgi:beta-glucosidase